MGLGFGNFCENPGRIQEIPEGKITIFLIFVFFFYFLPRIGFQDLAEFSGISGTLEWDLGLILKICDLELGFGICFENLGSGIGIWDWF